MKFGAILFFCLLFSSLPAYAGVMPADTLWQGKVELKEDLVIPAGVTLTVKAGTHVQVAVAESSRTDPEYLSPLTEITVRGSLIVEGDTDSPVLFSGSTKKAGSWAGLIVDGGSVHISNCRIEYAETGLHLLGGRAGLNGVTIENNRYGVVVQGEQSHISLTGSTIRSNEYGLLNFRRAAVRYVETTIKDNSKKDYFKSAPEPAAKAFTPPQLIDTPVARRYKDEVLRGDTVWQGRIRVEGIIRVPEGSRLLLLPGTMVEFSKRDTNGDGIGENGILVQGVIIAKGTEQFPILFRSAEPGRSMGDWDAINIMNSDSTQNLLEYCTIQDAYRALHFHFSNVAVRHSLLFNNYRGIQFQESIVDIRKNRIRGNKSGIQGRDSDVILAENNIEDNLVGAHFLRTSLKVNGNNLSTNRKEALRIRESAAVVTENQFADNRTGLMVADSYFGDYRNNSISNNYENGLLIKNSANIELSGNIIAANGLNGINIQESSADIKGNLIADNGAYGLGAIDHTGTVYGNNFAANGAYAIDLDGAVEMNAAGNWWGGDRPENVIFDHHKDSARPVVRYEKSVDQPFRITYPLKEVTRSSGWRGRLLLDRSVSVNSGATLTVLPGTTVEFSPGAGLFVKGRLLSNGTGDQPIIYTAAGKKEAGSWDEIQLDYATGSTVSYSVFEYANWGLHAHFTNLKISNSLFSHNGGGIRFRSGPVEIADSRFFNNKIGIRSYLGNAHIHGSNIQHNEVGIFVREGGRGLKITGNTIASNSSYNLRNGDFNTEDVAAAGNWWGAGEPADSIFDAADEPGIGHVLYKPFLPHPAVSERAR